MFWNILEKFRIFLLWMNREQQYFRHAIIFLIDESHYKSRSQVYDHMFFEIKFER